MTVLSELVNVESNLDGFRGLGFDRSQVVSKSAAFASYFLDSYAFSQGKSRWVDKSPEYVWHLDWLAELFPSARFLLLTRYPLDQINSHVEGRHDLRQRFQNIATVEGEDIRVTAARYWLAATQAQLGFLATNPDRAMCFKYEDLCRAPESLTKAVFEFIGVPNEPAAVQYWDQHHDFGLEDDIARRSKSLKLSTGGYRRWPASIQDQCLALSEPVLSAVGWEDGQYPDSPGRESP